MASSAGGVAPRRVGMRIPPEVNRILFVKSLPYKISEEDMYDIFGKYGAIRQIRLGNTNATRGTAYVVYDDIFQAKFACENLNGFQVAGRYLILVDIPADVFTGSILKHVSLDDAVAMIQSGPVMASYVRDAFRALLLAPPTDFPKNRIVSAALILSQQDRTVGSLPHVLLRVFVHHLLANETEDGDGAASISFLRYTTWDDVKLGDVAYEDWVDVLDDYICKVMPNLAGTLVLSLFENALRSGRSVKPINVAQVIRAYSERNERSLVSTLVFAGAFIQPHRTTKSDGLERGRIIAELTAQWGGRVTALLLSSSCVPMGLSDSDDDYEVALLTLEVYPHASFYTYGSILQQLSVAVVSNIIRIMRVKFGLEPHALAAYTCFASQNWTNSHRLALYDNLNSLPSSYREVFRSKLSNFNDNRSTEGL